MNGTDIKWGIVSGALSVLLLIPIQVVRTGVIRRDVYTARFYIMLKGNPCNLARDLPERVYEEAAQEFRDTCVRESLPPRAFYNMLRRESWDSCCGSCGHIYAFNGSYKARGLGQITKIGAREYWRLKRDIPLFTKKGKLNIWVLYAPKNNVRISGFLLALNRRSAKGDIRKAIAYYNTGKKTIDNAEFAYWWADKILSDK